MIKRGVKVLKGIKGGVLIEIKEIESDLIELENKLKTNTSFGKGVDFVLEEKDKEHFSKLWELLNKYQHNLFIIREKKVEKRVEKIVEKVVEKKVYEGLDTMVVKRNLRSGQKVESEGNVVIIGDINPGAQVIAGGDIYVFGKAKGILHAGKNGDRDAKILALSLEANQMRIGDIYTKKGEGKSEAGVAEIAYLNSVNSIIVEEYKRV